MGDRCGNKRFTRRRYCRTEVFRTELKGYGLRALQDLPAGAFIYEYVGEVSKRLEHERRKDFSYCVYVVLHSCACSAWDDRAYLADDEICDIGSVVSIPLWQLGK